jgi:hypothetical protein
VTPPDQRIVAAAEAEGVPEISAESAITSNTAAAADEADDLAGVTDDQAAATDEAAPGTE